MIFPTSYLELIATLHVFLQPITVLDDFTQVKASDKDAGTNADITYSIISGDDDVKKFSINQTSGNM